MVKYSCREYSHTSTSSAAVLAKGESAFRACYLMFSTLLLQNPPIEYLYTVVELELVIIGATSIFSMQQPTEPIVLIALVIGLERSTNIII